MTRVVSALIVDFYTRQGTLNLVRDLQDWGEVHEILIIDNTGDVKYQSAWPVGLSRTRIVKNDRRAGFGEGVNLGARYAAEGAHLLILNSDLRILAGSLRALLDMLEEENIGAVAPQIVDSTGGPQVDASGRFPDVSTTTTGPDWITGACMLVRRDVFEQLGGFDEQFYMYWEDVDFCRRLYEHGLAVAIGGSLTVSHQSGGSDGSRASRYARAAMGRDRYFAKWNPGGSRRALLRWYAKLKLYGMRCRGL